MVIFFIGVLPREFVAWACVTITCGLHVAHIFENGVGLVNVFNTSASEESNVMFPVHLSQECAYEQALQIMGKRWRQPLSRYLRQGVGGRARCVDASKKAVGVRHHPQGNVLRREKSHHIPHFTRSGKTRCGAKVRGCVGFRMHDTTRTTE